MDLSDFYRRYLIIFNRYFTGKIQDKGTEWGACLLF